MALMDAKEYDPRPAQRRWRLIGLAVAVAVGACVFRWFFRYWPEERVVNKFFEAIERKDFDAAYGIYFADPDWRQHPAKYNQYPPPQFMQDWGPSSEYAVIATHKIDCATEPTKKESRSPSGVIVAVTVNGRSQTLLWVEKKDKTITLAPDLWEVHCHGPG
jgi:hypothetical protein